MKEMLDELKKMDRECEAPVNFSKNVMKKIRTIEAQKKKDARKYVITWASSVAVVLIAVTVSLRTNLKFGEFILEKNGIQNADQMYLTSNNIDENLENISDASENYLNEAKENSSNIIKSEYSSSNNVNNNLEANDISNSDNSSCILTWMYKSEAKKDIPTNVDKSGDDYSKNIEEILLGNNITIEEINEEYMILDADIDDVRIILKEYENLINITEVNGKVKIQKEV